jgi:biopolymer transport protein TolR
MGAGGLPKGGGGGRRRGRRSGRRAALMAEINVTPMVDVMLVLLIIFMVAAPMLTVGVPVDLPQTGAPALNDEREPLTVSVNNNGDIFIQVMKVMGTIAGAGFKRVALVTEQEQGS